MKRAFSLIEVVVASGILIIVAGASVALSNNVLRGSQTLSERTAATYLAVEGLENAQRERDTAYIDGNPNTGWADLLDKPDTWNIPATIELNGVKYTRAIAVTGSNDDPRTITAEVKWGSDKVSLSTKLADIFSPK